MAKTNKIPSTSFKYRNEEDLYRTRQAAAIMHLSVNDYILKAVIAQNSEILDKIR